MDLHSLILAPAYAEMFVLGAACVILMVDLFLRDEQRWVTATLTFVALAGAAAITTYVSGVESRVTTLGEMFVADVQIVRIEGRGQL